MFLMAMMALMMCGLAACSSSDDENGGQPANIQYGYPNGGQPVNNQYGYPNGNQPVNNEEGGNDNA